ncbi:hypothetical protein HK102_002286 [Quaeritorhiza haematococci]|nr:hypothetical protein HK102_002286 [Quaeritorhiza haematococci]
MKLYIPVHLIPTLVFNGRRFLQPSTFRHILLSAARSSAFLATFIATIFYTICLVRNQTKNDKPFGPVLGSFLCGFSLLIEKKKRRRDMGLYVLPKALESLYYRMVTSRNGGMTAVSSGIARKGGLLKHGDVAIFALSMGYFLSTVIHEPEAVTPAIRGILGFFLVKS